METITQQNKEKSILKVTGVFWESIIGFSISGILLFLFFKISFSVLAHSQYINERVGTIKVIVFGVVYMIIATSVLIYFRNSKYLTVSRLVYWSSFIVFCYIGLLILFSSGVGSLPVINGIFLLGFLFLVPPGGNLLFRSIEKTILQPPFELESKAESVSITQKLKSFFMDEKPKL